MASAPKLDLSPGDLKIVLDILARHVPDREVWAFGSRATWKTKDYSDLDLAIIGDEPLSLKLSAALSDDFAESDLPFKVDVVDWATTSESFREIIKRDRVVVREPVAGWRESTWGEEVSLEYGKGMRNYTLSHGRYPVYGSNGRIGWSDEYLAPGPGVVLGRKGAYRGVEYSKAPFFVIDTAYYVVARRQHNYRWLYYAVKYHALGDIDDGSPIPSTTRAAVYVRQLNVPPPEEQNGIASTLGALDDKIDLNRRMNETLEAMARALFDDAEQHEDWEEQELSRVCDIFDGPHATPPLAKEGGVFLGISNLADGMLDLADTKHVAEVDFAHWTRRVTPREGDLVFSYETRLGQAALIPAGLRCCLGRRMGLLRLKVDWLDPAVFLRAYLAPGFQETIRQRTIPGSTVDRIPLKEMGAFPIALPSKTSAQRLNSQLKPLRKKVEVNQRESETLASLRDLLLPRLLSGQLRIRDAEKMVADAV